MIFFWKGGPATSTTPHSLDAYGESPLLTEILNMPNINTKKKLEVLSLLSPIVHDTSKIAKITWFILVLHWGMDVIYDFYYIHGPMEY